MHHPSCNLLFLFLFLFTGCGGYASLSDSFRQSFTQGQIQKAEKDVDEALGVGSSQQLPKKSSKNTPLLLLERGTILQAKGDYELSARDFQVADQQLEILDLTHDTPGAIAKYLYSDDAKVYKAPAYEKLLLSTLNMLNYLVLGDLQNAKVEARRFTISRNYYKSIGESEDHLLAFGSYLAGFTFEKAGDADEAMRHYADAYASGGISGLQQTVQRLHSRTRAKDARIASFLNGSIDKNPSKNGELLVVIQEGLVPYKRAVREAIGAAVAIATKPGPGARLTPAEAQRANALAAQSTMKWINYPQLTRVAYQPKPADLFVDNQKYAHSKALEIEERVIAYNDEQQGAVVTSAITRMISRAIAAQAAQATTQAIAKSSSKTSDSASALGFLVGLIVEGGMSAADTPDTRSWVTLPARMRFARISLPEGEHLIQLKRGSRYEEVTVSLKSNGFAVVNFSALR